MPIARASPRLTAWATRYIFNALDRILSLPARDLSSVSQCMQYVASKTACGEACASAGSTACLDQGVARLLPPPGREAAADGERRAAGHPCAIDELVRAALA